MGFCNECGNRKKLNKDKVCKDCCKDDDNDGMQDEARANDGDDFWKKMDVMFDKKLEKFEEKLHASIKEEVQKVTNPMKTQITKLENENKNLKAEVTVLKASQKEVKEKTEKIVKVLKEQQITLARSDKNDRFKRLILSGAPGEETTINGKKLVTDKEKVDEILTVLQMGAVTPVSIRRIGNKDQGDKKWPRYIVIEFASSDDRNKVRKVSEKLKEHEDTKNYFLKADKTKKEREEYKKLYDIKKKIEQDEPEKKVEINYGKLFVDGTVVSKIETENKDFLA